MIPIDAFGSLPFCRCMWYIPFLTSPVRWPGPFCFLCHSHIHTHYHYHYHYHCHYRCHFHTSSIRPKEPPVQTYLSYNAYVP